jgi:hypothetical protein
VKRTSWNRGTGLLLLFSIRILEASLYCGVPSDLQEPLGVRGAGGVDVIYLNFRSRATIPDHGHRFLPEDAPFFDHFDHLHKTFLAADFGPLLYK